MRSRISLPVGTGNLNGAPILVIVGLLSARHLQFVVLYFAQDPFQGGGEPLSELGLLAAGRLAYLVDAGLNFPATLQWISIKVASMSKVTDWHS